MMLMISIIACVKLLITFPGAASAVSDAGVRWERDQCWAGQAAAGVALGQVPAR